MAIAPDTKDWTWVLDRRLRSNGSEFTVETIGSFHLHDVVHHLHDVGAG